MTDDLYGMTWEQARILGFAGQRIRRIGWMFWLEYAEGKWWLVDGEERHVVRAGEMLVEDHNAFDWTNAPWDESDKCLRPPLQAPAIVPEPVKAWYVIRYSWSAASGTDLDTRTALIDCDPLVDGQTVGWFSGGQVEVVSGGGGVILLWADDNTHSGTEAVLLDEGELRLTFPEVNFIKVRLRAHWFGAPGTGDVVISAALYYSAAMPVTGEYNFKLSGRPIAEVSANRVVTATNESLEAGQNLGVLEINLYSGELQILAP